jgi:plastocyanin
MRPKAALPAILILGLALLLGGCGGGGDTTTSTQTETESGASEGAESEGATSEGGGQAGGNAPAPSGEAVRSQKVEIVNFSYDPDPVTIQEGGKVIWLNQDSAPHTATADDGSFDTGVLQEGKLKSETFKEAGTFTYHCELHPNMHGTIEVVEAG